MSTNPSSCSYVLSTDELQCYQDNYPQDLGGMNNSDLQNNWSSTGCTQGRNNQCPSQQTSSGSYSYQGCFNDSSIRAIPNQQQNVSSVDECAQIAVDNNDSVFGVQYYGQCFTGNNIEDAYQYGPNYSSSACPSMGGAWTNQVYAIANPYPSTTTSKPVLTSANFASSNETFQNSSLIEKFSNTLSEDEKKRSINNICKYIFYIIIIIIILMLLGAYT
jgi:hypothetical protein